LAKPQIREFPFQAQLFENYQRSEKALLLSICQMVTDGVSTNRVKKIVGRLSPDLTYSKSTVSRITQELDPQIKRWQDEKLKDYYTYIITDALSLIQHKMRQKSVLNNIFDRTDTRVIITI
jgi:transposase-like protein